MSLQTFVLKPLLAFYITPLYYFRTYTISTSPSNWNLDANNVSLLFEITIFNSAVAMSQSWGDSRNYWSVFDTHRSTNVLDLEFFLIDIIHEDEIIENMLAIEW